MLQLKLNHVTDAETIDSRWGWLYKISGAAALLVVVILPIQIIVYIVSPPGPSTAIDYFMLFKSNSLLGLLALDLLIIVDIVLGIPLLLALYIALRRSSESFMAIALALCFFGNTASITSNTAFNMLYLSKQYATATTDAQRSLFLAAGEAMFSILNGTAFQLYYVLGFVVMIIISAVMLRSNILSKVTVYMGILAGVIGFGLYVPTIGIYISIFSVVFMAIWYILIIRSLFQLGQSVSKKEVNRN